MSTFTANSIQLILAVLLINAGYSVVIEAYRLISTACELRRLMCDLAHASNKPCKNH